MKLTESQKNYAYGFSGMAAGAGVSIGMRYFPETSENIPLIGDALNGFIPNLGRYNTFLPLIGGGLLLLAYKNKIALGASLGMLLGGIINLISPTAAPPPAARFAQARRNLQMMRRRPRIIRNPTNQAPLGVVHHGRGYSQNPESAAARAAYKERSISPGPIPSTPIKQTPRDYFYQQDPYTVQSTIKPPKPAMIRSFEATPTFSPGRTILA